MSHYPRSGARPETLVKILITLIEKTPSGGATLKELQEAYAEINDRSPSERTIYRFIRRLNLFFDPLCYGEEDDPGEEWTAGESGEVVTGQRAICSRRCGRKTFYIFQGVSGGLSAGVHDTTMLLLGMYPQLRGAMKGSIEAAMQSVFRNTLYGLSNFAAILSELEHVVHLSGAFPAEPAKSEAMIREIMRAIREKKRVSLSYLRTYDGAVTERVVEPHGLLCRLNNWYLTGQCMQRRQRRIFLLLNIKDLTVMENSSYSMPPGFSLKDAYKDSWGTWTDDESEDLERVRLIVAAGPAERFRHNLFHESQYIMELPGERLEVTYRLTGAQEMIPWLMSWGGAIEVLEPAWLREQLIESLEETLKFYRQKP
ncbi:MAG: WYL domain-containing protein [Firmicutes bacterium]|nr:WYL domain-containing protein [Bacillota bacterium]